MMRTGSCGYRTRDCWRTMKRSAALATANEAFGYRGKMIESGEAPFKCRSGSRYLYVDEFGSVHWCYQTREVFSKHLLAYTYVDLREQFDTPKNCNAHCTIGCARTASATDQWRSQRGLTHAPLAATAS